MGVPGSGTRAMSGGAVQGAHAVEAEPAFALAAGVGGPVVPRRPLLRAEALAVQPRAPGFGVLPLAGEQVHPRARKVVEPAGMVEIEMRQHDVAHVGGAETKLFDLSHGSHLLAELGRQEAQEEAARRDSPRSEIVALPPGPVERARLVDPVHERQRSDHEREVDGRRAAPVVRRLDHLGVAAGEELLGDLGVTRSID